MKLVPGLVLLATAVAALLLLQRPAPAEPLTVLDLHQSRAGQYPPTVLLKTGMRATSEGAYLKDERCDPNGNDISPIFISERLEQDPKVQALYAASFRSETAGRRLALILKVRPIYRVRRQLPGVGLKPAQFSGVSLVAVESIAIEARAETDTAWRCERRWAPPRPPQGQR